MSWVPEGFTVPDLYRPDPGAGLRLELLGPRHNESDHAAWMSSIDHIRATPGFDRGWPPPGGMTLEENLADLRSHADRSARRVDFAYSVLDDDTNDVVGCVYLTPAPDGVVATSWVTAARSDLDTALTGIVGDWLARDWPFAVVRYRLE